MVALEVREGRRELIGRMFYLNGCVGVIVQALPVGDTIVMSQFGPKNPAAWARPPGANQQLNAGLFQNPLIGAQPFAQMGMINAAAFSQQAVGNMGMNLGMLQTPSQTIRMQAQQQLIGDKSGPGGGGPATHTPPERGRQPMSGRGMIPGEQSWTGKTLEKPQTITHINDSRSRDFRASPRSRSPLGAIRHRSPRGAPCGPPALVQDMRRMSPSRRISPPRVLTRRTPRRFCFFSLRIV
ncbi:unnamed protein product [Onchocerca flexuosa]|uniref:SH3 domain-containing protein n=1 Tax=Onchocerca flexuosa TaxID=387005 RepID=A0A183I3F1_9BILA|nr:unnamed protein product [Onchocerca flexuosa]